MKNKKKLIVLVLACLVILGYFIFENSDSSGLLNTENICTSKVVMKGNCVVLHEGVEYDSSIGKCVVVDGSGCEFKTPFETMKECQAVCEVFDTELQSKIEEKKIELNSRIDEENKSGIRSSVDTKIPLLYSGDREWVVIDLDKYICDVASNYGGAIGTSEFKLGYVCLIKPSANLFDKRGVKYSSTKELLKNKLDSLSDDRSERYIVSTEVPVIGRCFGSGEQLVPINVSGRICDRCYAIDMAGVACSGGCYSCRMENVQKKVVNAEF